MGLESSAVYIGDLNSSWPVGASDRFTFCDEHIRLLKSTLKETFPAVTSAVTATHTELNLIDGVTATTAEINILDGATLSTAELNYLDDVTSNVQTQLNSKFGLLTVEVVSSGSGKSLYFNSQKHYVYRGSAVAPIIRPTLYTVGGMMRITNITGNTLNVEIDWSPKTTNGTVNGTLTNTISVANDTTVELMVIAEITVDVQGGGSATVPDAFSKHDA
jgi:hypothetical protein